MIRRLTRIFTHDPGRKLLALVFALVLFEQLDREIQAEGEITLLVVYVDHSSLERERGAPGPENAVIVTEREDPLAPLVVSAATRPSAITLRLGATRDALARARTQRHRMVLRLPSAGPLQPAAADLVGIEDLLAELGPGASVRIEPPVTFEVEVESSHELVLDSAHLKLEKNPAPAFDRGKFKVIFSPQEIRVVGPISAVSQIRNRPEDLFEPVVLDPASGEVERRIGLHPNWSGRLRLQTAAKGDLDTVRVSLKFERWMKPVPREKEGVVALRVKPLPPSVDAAPGEEAWEARIVDEDGGPLFLDVRILAPGATVDAGVLDRTKLSQARRSVELLVRAEYAPGVKAVRLPVIVWKLPDFPPDLDAVLDDPSRDEVEVRFEPRAVAPSTAGDGDVPGAGDDAHDE